MKLRGCYFNGSRPPENPDTRGTSADIDNLLWLSQDIAGDVPFHLTETRLY